MTGHTPGPWYSLSGNVIANTVGPEWADDKHFVAHCNPNNAHLIAAAPDLLQALEQILGWQKLRRGLGEIPIERIEQIAEAAIGKAKGTTVGP